MTNRKKSFIIRFMTVILVIISTQVLANAKTEKPSTQASTQALSKKNQDYHLRCWQQGKLLFEETGLSHKGAHNLNSTTALTFDKIQGDDGHPSIQLLQLGSTTCFFRKNPSIH